MNKPYKTGMYGGKFFPMHRGHLHCLAVASSICESVYLVMFINGKDELNETSDWKMLDVNSRIEQVLNAAGMYGNVAVVIIDVAGCVDENGEEDWDAETPLVLRQCGRFDAVFSSEPAYDDYFKRAYPWAEHVLVDPDRKTVPISATELRAMDESEAMKWMV